MSNCCDNPVTEADQETHLQHGLLEPQAESEPVLLPLTPTAELDDHNSALNTRDIMNNINGHPLNSPPDQTDLLAEEPLEDFSMELMEEDDIISFLSQVDVGRMEPEHRPGIDVNFQSSNSTLPLDGNVMTQDLVGSPPSHLLGYEDNENDLPVPLSDLLEDAAILDEIRLLDQALEEGFSPEMAARLENESCFNHELAEQEIGSDDDHLGSKIAVIENHGRPSTHHHGNSTDCEGELDSDSGLSLDFSHSPASPCTSEASSCSSSSTSSSFYVSATGSSFSKDDDEDSEEDLAGSDVEAVMMIKQEELEEEDMGAVGGENHENKLVPVDYSDHSLFHGFSWLEHIGHDHTYNMPWSSACSIPLGKMPTKHTKSTQQRDSVKPYPQSFSRSISENKIWGQDERRAQTLKIPFSNELIVNLPVEEFNSLLSNYQLSEEQLTLIKDIRRRGKNKIAAQNCRKRKQDVLFGLEDDVSSLRRHRSRLLREKRETLRNLQEIRRHMEMLYKEVFSRLTREEGSPMDATEYMLHFKPNGRNSKKQNQRDKKK
uniref:Endoplasmic reticulum membrane sensor NFE2L1 n=2 Tax=Neolamprologus brichardi TaxID=32507 RepID=A0A3Q4H6M9_NEOBR